MFVGGRRLRLVPIALALALGLGPGLVGCGGSSDKPRTLPPLSTSPSTTPTAAPTQNPKAAAVAVVREYFRAKNQLATDTKAERLAAVTTSDCACRELVRSARRLDRRGQHYFGQASVTGMAPSLDNPQEVEVFATYDSTAGGIKDSSGRVVSHGRSHHNVRQLFDVRLINGTWLVADIVLVRSGN